MSAPPTVRQWLADRRATAYKQPPARGWAPASAQDPATQAGQEPQADTRPLRERMPQTAELFAWLRQAWGQEQTDRLVRRMARGEPVGYCAEVDEAGRLHEFGRSPQGARAVIARDDAGRFRLRYIRPDGTPVPATEDLPRVPARLWDAKGKEIKL